MVEPDHALLAKNPAYRPAKGKPRDLRGFPMFPRRRRGSPRELAVRRPHSGRVTDTALGTRCLRGREPGFPPGDEAADDVARAFEAEVDESGGGEGRGAAVVAEQQDLPVEGADVRVAPGAVRIETPFEHGARNVERAGNDAVALAVDVRTDIDEQRAPLRRRESVGRFEPVDPRLRSLEQLVERSPFGSDSHPQMIRRQRQPVQVTSPACTP